MAVEDQPKSRLLARSELLPLRKPMKVRTLLPGCKIDVFYRCDECGEDDVKQAGID
jgi:hypothetical protein